MHPFKSISYVSPQPGTRLVVLGAVHGDEICGTRAIERVVAELDAGTLTLVKGRVTFVPVTNPLAYAEKRRAGDRNLNRKLQPTATPREYEDHVANWLCPLLAEHEVLLDLHSFRAPGVPFVFIGPRDNAGPLEPFAQAACEEALALRLGVGRVVDGWLATYAAGIARRRELAAAFPTPCSTSIRPTASARPSTCARSAARPSRSNAASTRIRARSTSATRRSSTRWRTSA
jgi:predicted deacylase